MQSSQAKEARHLGSLAVQPVPKDGPTVAERVHSEAQRPVAPMSADRVATSTAPGYPHQHTPVPPLRQFAPIPSYTTAAIQTLREASAEEETADSVHTEETSDDRTPFRLAEAEDAPAADRPSAVPPEATAAAPTSPGVAAADVEASLDALRKTGEVPTVDIHR